MVSGVQEFGWRRSLHRARPSGVGSGGRCVGFVPGGGGEVGARELVVCGGERTQACGQMRQVGGGVDVNQAAVGVDGFVAGHEGCVGSELAGQGVQAGSQVGQVGGGVCSGEAAVEVDGFFGGG